MDGGQNLAQGGIMSYTHDVLYISLFLQVATTLLSDWFFLVLLLVCASAHHPSHTTTFAGQVDNKCG